MINSIEKHISNSHIENINSRYSKRLLEHGDSPLTLGWSDKGQQHQRFSRFHGMISQVKESYSILDIGCGFGDFASYLDASEIPPSLYTGLDINNELLKIARSKEYSFKTEYYCENILDGTNSECQGAVKHTFVVAAGLLNYNFHGSLDRMHEFAFAMIERMISLSSERVIIDFIPDERIDFYEPEPYIALYSIEKILSYLNAKRLRYALDMMQKPNPMQEALLVINVDNN